MKFGTSKVNCGICPVKEVCEIAEKGNLECPIVELLERKNLLKTAGV